MFPTDVQHDVGIWHVAPAAWGLIILAVGGYCTWRMLKPAEPQWQRRANTGALGTLVVSIWFAGSFLQRDAMRYESVHMASHLVVMLVIAPLAVLAVSTSSYARVSSWTPLRALRNPVVCFLMLAILIPAFHLTLFGAKVMEYNALHAVELAFFGLVGLFYWRLVLSVSSEIHLPTYGQRVAYVTLAIPVIFFAGVAMMSMDHPLATMGNLSSSQAVHDVHQAGLVMIVVGDGLLSFYAIGLFAAWWMSGRARRVDPLGRGRLVVSAT